MHDQRPATTESGVALPAASIRLAAWWSVVAALVAVVLRAVTDVPQAPVVLAVIVVGFSLSWHATAPRRDAR